MEAERIPAGPTHGGVEVALGDAHEPGQLEPDDLVGPLQHRDDVVQAPVPHLRSVHLDKLRGYKVIHDNSILLQFSGTRIHAT